MTRKWYSTLRHPKMHPHTKFGIPTSKNIGDMHRTRSGTDGWTVRLLYASQSSFGGIKTRNQLIINTSPVLVMKQMLFLENPITISGITISFEFFILQKLIHPEILGMDFLKFHKVQTDLDKRTIYIQDKLVSACFLKRKTSLARTGKCVTIPAGSQMNIELKVSRRKPGEVVLLEPIPNLQSKHLAGAKCLVTAKQGWV